MGSGHFLTKATGYLTEQVMNVVREQEIQSYDEREFRRRVSKECIYGVDVNGMAVELAKLSMWLETLAADQPLAFLDHHLKTGNSLVGSDITDVLSDGEAGGQLTLTEAFARTRKRALDHVMDRVSELLAIDNETLADIKSMEEIYADVRADPLYGRLFAMANVHTASAFGLDVPDDAIEQMARAIEDDGDWAAIEDEDWFRSAQAMADDEAFFHWELEFPEVFFDIDGNRMDEAGFDAVVGNPPYVKIQNLRATASDFADYLVEEYQTASGRFDIYATFIEEGSRLAKDSNLRYIVPNRFFESGGGKPLRAYLSDTEYASEILNFKQHQIFDGVTTYTCILGLGVGDSTLRYGVIREQPRSIEGLRDIQRGQISISDLNDDNWALSGPRERSVLQKIKSEGEQLGDLSEYLSEGIVSGDNEILFVDIIGTSGGQIKIQCSANGKEYKIESEIVHELVGGDDISRYGPSSSDSGVIYPYEVQNGDHSLIPEEKLEQKFPEIYSYLSEFRERLQDRGTQSMRYHSWYALYRSREKQLFDSSKLIVPDVCQQPEFAADDSGEIYLPDSAYGIVPTNNRESYRDFLLAVLNSTLTWFFIYHTSPTLRGDFRRFKTSYLSPLPIPGTDEVSARCAEMSEEMEAWISTPEYSRPSFSKPDILSFLGQEMKKTHQQKDNLNLNLLDHLGTYADGPTLAAVGFTQPAEGVAESMLHETTETRAKLGITDVSVEREGPNTLTVSVAVRYKPDDPGAYETDSNGYRYVDSIEALRVTDLTEREADLVASFVPVAVADELGGFRKTAAKTISPMDRLEALTLPAVEDVAGGLAQYRETEERAAELDAKIERTDDLIDEIVYELYGLTDEEIEIVEEAVGD